MRIQAAVFVTTALLASPAFGQPAEETLDRVFSFTHTEREQNPWQVATILRTVADIKKLSVDAEKRTISLSGTNDQLALANWLLQTLDRPTADPTRTEYDRAEPGDFRIVRVFYATRELSEANLLQLGTLLRVIPQCGKLFAYSRLRAIVMAGTADQMGLAEWIFNDLDRPTQAPAAHERKISGSNEVVRLFYLAHAATPQRVHDIVSQIRNSTDMRFLFDYDEARAIAARGTSAEVAAVERYIHDLDRP
jgi:hypothetical protein